MAAEHYSSLSYLELKSLLRKLGLPSTGKKAELILRLDDYYISANSSIYKSPIKSSTSKSITSKSPIKSSTSKKSIKSSIKSSTAITQTIPLPHLEPSNNIDELKINPDLEYVRHFYDQRESKNIFKQLQTLPYISSEHLFFNKHTSSSVKYVWFSDTLLPYIFGKTMTNELPAHPFSSSPFLMDIREKVESYTNRTFNSVLINMYLDGSTKLSYHHDDDPWLGECFIVPSLSFGDKRRFLVKQKPSTAKSLNATEPKIIEYILESGSMVLMGESMQKYWLHAVPLQKNSIDNKKIKTGLRFNLTFRDVKEELYHKMPKSRV